MRTPRALLIQLSLIVAVAVVPRPAQAEVWEVGGGAVVEITQNRVRPAPAPVALPTVPESAVNGTAPFRAHFAAAAERYGVSADLLDAVAWQESRYHPKARSPVGAIGIMQLMPGTARALGVGDPREPGQNIAGGAAYLRAQLDRFDNDLPRALAAYNAGPGAVARYGGIPPYRETLAYVRSVLGRLASMVSTR